MSPTISLPHVGPGLRRALLIAVVTVCVVAGGASVVLLRPTAASAATHAPYARLVQQLLARLNATRAANGIAPVGLDRDLTAAAVSHSRKMAKHHRLAVRFANEPSLAPQVRSYGYVPRVVAQTMASAKTPHSLRKRPHQLAQGPSTLLGAGFTDVGIGISRRHDGRYWVTFLVSRPGQATADQLSASYAQNILRMLNGERADHGLPPLTMNAKLISSAHAHNLDMARQNTMSHQLPGEAYFATRIQRAGYNYDWAGENIGWNSDTSLDGVRALETMMYNEKPPNDGHRQNILSPNFTNVGIDVYFDTVNNKVWLTQDFGSPA